MPNFKPPAGSYRLTSTGTQTGGQQMDVTVNPDGTIASPILGALEWKGPPVAAFVSAEGEVALQFSQPDSTFIVILNGAGHAGTWAPLPA